MQAITAGAGARTAVPMPHEYLAFTLGTEEYGVDIQTVQELRGYDTITRLANAPDYLKGVINLRGIIVPIIDLRMKFGMPDPRYDQFTVVIILNLHGREVGMVVDSVSDVTRLGADMIKPAPAMGQASHVLGIGIDGERMLTLIDIQQLMQFSTSADDLALAA